MIDSNNALSTTLFAEHLEKLELLSLATRRLASPLPQIASAEKTLAQVWDILSKSLPSDGVADMDYLSTLSSIIQRTASATKQIKSLESETVDLARKALDFEATKQALLNGLSAAKADASGEISPQTLSLLEERLRLL